MTFADLKLKCDAVIASSDAFLDEKKIKVYRREIQDLVSSIGPVPVGGSVADISVMIATVQAAKDRVSDIANSAHSSYVLLEGVCGLMEDAAPSASVQSSADKRKAEGALLSGEYTIMSASAEAFYKFCLGSMRNLDSKHDALSRIITCIQMVANGIAFHGRSAPEAAVGDQNRRKWNAMRDQEDGSENCSGREVF